MILAVINATFAVAKRKSEKKDRGFESRTSLNFLPLYFCSFSLFFLSLFLP